MFPSNTSFFSTKLKVLSLWFCFVVVKFCPQFSFSCRYGGQRKVPILLSRKQNIFPKTISAFSFFTRNGPKGYPQLQKSVRKRFCGCSAAVWEGDRRGGLRRALGKPSIRDPHPSVVWGHFLSSSPASCLQSPKSIVFIETQAYGISTY